MATDYISLTTHGQENKNTGLTGYQQALAKDTERLFYELERTFGREKAFALFETA